ncbi:MAG: GFA family protein [Deltaproteobacteria bacterium]|nr:GFA family protein [Deltaproteobacteria bacterium]
MLAGGLRYHERVTTQTYKGSCACRRVRFEVALDLSEGTYKCNCTSCWKRRWWSVRGRPEDFRVLEGAPDLTARGGSSRPGGFCKHCGTHIYEHVAADAWNDGAFVSINVACLDDLAPADLAAAPVQYFDGRADDWWSTPRETRHL